MTTRTRTYHWQEPASPPDLPGLEIMRGLLAGEIPPPPMIQTLGLDLIEVETGRVVFAVKPAEYMYNGSGIVHGGFTASMMDSAAGCALHTTLPAGVGYTSLDLSVKFLRAITEQSGAIRCVGTLAHVGRRTALAEARMTDATDRLLASATSSLMIFR
ncbi:PaaI family thioesterase [Kibdelosporangium persicum]|uniref:Aromatic compound degradation protein PaaI n=1 Tax=Kibdelosporangium persicum TaxID=2698649 RepID=A0ABX2EZ36_9PSEU|nr:PaaI family thioesterase [Kibdelosporangium persicum]NRN64311.1 Aromatic compound degradation protein PaaI [Kibdelosporangium persicum]